MDHRPRHRALDQDDIATTIMPRIDVDYVDAPPPSAPQPSAPPPDAPRPGTPRPPAPRPPTPRPPAPHPDTPDVEEPRPDSADATAIIPKITADPAETAYIPKFSEPPAEATAVLEKLPPKPPSDQPPALTPEDKPDATEDAPKGAIVVPLRPVRTEEGYRSVYSEYTRTTFGSVARAVSRATGEVLITFGLIVLLFAGYEVWGKSAIVDAHQDELNQQLEQQWANQPTVGPSAPPTTAVKPPNGAVIASVHIPRLKKKWAIVQGVTPADIRYAPGHYPDTALPGQVGNFSMAGHRTPAIWWDLDQLKPGDAVVIKTADTWFVYRVVGHEIVLPTAVQVVAPVPDKPGAAPTKAMLTMTTCNPKFNNYQRYVVHAELDRSQPVADGDPAELKG